MWPQLVVLATSLWVWWEGFEVAGVMRVGQWDVELCVALLAPRASLKALNVSRNTLLAG